MVLLVQNIKISQPTTRERAVSFPDKRGLFVCACCRFDQVEGLA